MHRSERSVGAGLELTIPPWRDGRSKRLVRRRVLALAVFAAAFLVGAVFQSRTAIGAGRAAAAGDQAEATRKLRRWVWRMGLILAFLVVITWDMVIKPGL
jgi:hypothetical protein